MFCHATPTRSRVPASPGSTRRRRRGAITVFAALLMIAMMAMLAFSIDVGYIATVQTELQRCVDAGALAGAGVLVEGSTVADDTVRNYLQLNTVAQTTVGNDDIEVETGHWNDASRSFLASTELPSAIRVRAVRNNQQTFFARVIGTDSFNVQAEAIAMYQPRDIMLVLDYSASMNDDSEFQHKNSIGLEAIKANLLQIYQDLGSPTYGNMQWEPQYIASDDANVVKTTLGLSLVPYPFPSGSWNDYISYVRTNSYVNSAGYRRKYGYMTFMNYLLENQPKYNQTPSLWDTREQPITALKNAVTVFLAYLQEVETDDRLGLSVYTYSDGTARLESGLTHDMPHVEDISRHRQAGHYDYYTNISAGMQKARLELENNARVGAFKMIVLMTDGIANRPSNSTVGRQAALNEAGLAANDHYPIVTISLGAEADTALMQQIADMTAGVHFNIPGNQTVAEVEEDLKDVFRAIADDHPLKLVQ